MSKAVAAIDLNAVTLPKGVEMKPGKSAITFIRGEKKAVLKGRALEVTNTPKTLKRIETYTEEIIEKCHLGAIKGVVRGVADAIDLTKILAAYYK
jgi:hypothetical protein